MARTGPNRIQKTVHDVQRASACASLLCLIFLIVLAALGCSKKAPPPEPIATTTAQPTGLEAVAPADAAKLPNFKDMSGWKNPYLVVREDGIGFVDFSNHEIRILKPEEIPAELVALPRDAWPYGRVVLVGQAMPEGATDAMRAEVLKNRALLMGTLKELDVEYREPPQPPPAIPKRASH